MKQPPKPLGQPQPAELFALEKLMQQGLFAPAEASAQALLTRYPKALNVYNLLGLSQQAQGKNLAAVSSFQKMLAIEPRIAEIHFNLGVIYTQLDDHPAAIFSYRQALKLKPNFTVAYFNLGTLLQAQNQWLEATQQYQQAIKLEPGFVDALANLGTIYQHSGQLAAAEQHYRQALALRLDARGYFNLGTCLYDQGQHDKAIQAFQEALKLEPHFADAWNDMGETLRDKGDMTEAVRCYQQANAAEPKHGRATYNLGEFYCLANRLEDAIPYFEASDFADAQERALQCHYKLQQFDIYKQKFDILATQKPHTSVLLGALSVHYAHNFDVENTYHFCKKPMDYVLHTRIDELNAPNNSLLDELLYDIQHLAIAERKQGRLYYGKQSAGNLLQRAEPAIQKLAALIRHKVLAYRQHFADSQDMIIKAFPQEIEFTSSWYLQMQQGGYLTSHIHEEGWISGCLYLKLPAKENAHAGSFAYSTDGDDYPRLHDNFPTQIVDQQVGDLVLFPSSLFHRTIPFQSNEERICVAFDVKPSTSVHVDSGF